MSADFDPVHLSHRPSNLREVRSIKTTRDKVESALKRDPKNQFSPQTLLSHFLQGLLYNPYIKVHTTPQTYSKYTNCVYKLDMQCVCACLIIAKQTLRPSPFPS